jgi:pimeloyl-ACP methyl ester carboxylesterase
MSYALRALATIVVGAAGAAVLAHGTASPAARDATVYTFKIHYLEAGSGQPVIFLHGLGGDGSRWAPNIGPLSADFRVIAPDQIGFGQSDKPLANYHSGMLAEFLAGLMKQTGVERASLVGNSMGASVATYFAVHYPQMVDKLVLVDGAGYRSAVRSGWPTAEQLHLRQIQNASTLDETREFWKILWHDDSRITEEMVHAAFVTRLQSAYAIGKMQEAGEMGRGGVTVEEMRSIKAPTLVVWGKYDELTDPAGADRLVTDIPGARKILIDNAGHLPQLEQAAEFNRIVRDFLRRAS